MSDDGEEGIVEFRITADQAREAVAEAHAPYTPEEVYEKIERLARSGKSWATFSRDRLSDRVGGDAGGGWVQLVCSQYLWQRDPRYLGPE